MRRIFDLYLGGYRIFAIAEALTADGIACPSAADPARNRHRDGLAWSKSAIRVILTNPRYTGRQVWNKQRTDEVLLDVEDVALGHAAVMRWNPRETWVVSKEAAHEALIDMEVFEQVQALLKRRAATTTSPKRGHWSRNPYVFKSLIICGLCRRKMQGQHSHGVAYYRCRYPAEYALTNHVDHPRNVTTAAMTVQAREQGRYLGGWPAYGYRLVDAGPHPNRRPWRRSWPIPVAPATRCGTVNPASRRPGAAGPHRRGRAAGPGRAIRAWPGGPGRSGGTRRGSGSSPPCPLIPPWSARVTSWPCRTCARPVGRRTDHIAGTCWRAWCGAGRAEDGWTVIGPMNAPATGVGTGTPAPTPARAGTRRRSTSVRTNSWPTCDTSPANTCPRYRTTPEIPRRFWGTRASRSSVMAGPDTSRAPAGGGRSWSDGPEISWGNYVSEGLDHCAHALHLQGRLLLVS